MIKPILTEYGWVWLINRLLYSVKLKSMRIIPKIESLFEKEVNIKRLDIFEINVDEIQIFLKRLSDKEQQDIIKQADDAVNGIIRGFSSIELNYGNPINWNYNPLTNTTVDSNKKWYAIPDFEKERGDIKVIWEISRFTHLYYMVRAFLITENKKYYEAFSMQIQSWVDNNSYSYGSNYKCGQESALRMINILITYSIFKKYGFITNKDEINVKKIIEVGYKKILSNFFYAHKCIKNNHTFSEICGLIIGSWCCEDKKRLKKSYELLENEISNQFMDDGGYIQYSFNYQRFSLQIIECIFKISEKTEINLSKKSKKIISDSAYLMYQAQDKSGDLPNYGSNDGALIFPVTTCGYRDFTSVINTVYCLINNKRLYVEGKYDEELLWFSKKDKLDYRLVAVERESKAFSHAGIYILRNDSGFMMITLPNYKTRPAEMDGLHVDLWSNGKNIFCDSGTYSYANEIGKNLSLTGAHNTVQVESREQMDKHGPFLIYNWTKSENIVFSKNKFKGTMISKNGYKHTRYIEYIDNTYIIDDIVKGKGEYCNFYFHTPFDVLIEANKVKILDKKKHICTMRISRGEISVNRKYRSLYYLKKEEVNCICIRCNIINDNCNITFNIKFEE
ncbi:heparinase II/III-like protein [[Clostridium] sordellii]|uniref:heparinase II/III family protein n=1 Tax=Paraclostridium sordellii TaxID=1505 RepID=UPI0005DF14C4|nr:heparinase II/III-family protein [Paeniclostridium sordellii]CEQ23925.1 heparinase II/III-like protein [[Clostridium] sordellii] [Paeniclostridium sordellii]